MVSSMKLREAQNRPERALVRAFQLDSRLEIAFESVVKRIIQPN